jgi:hypothetical protein
MEMDMYRNTMITFLIISLLLCSCGGSSSSKKLSPEEHKAFKKEIRAALPSRSVTVSLGVLNRSPEFEIDIGLYPQGGEKAPIDEVAALDGAVTLMKAAFTSKWRGRLLRCTVNVRKHPKNSDPDFVFCLTGGEGYVVDWKNEAELRTRLKAQLTASRMDAAEKESAKP